MNKKQIGLALAITCASSFALASPITSESAPELSGATVVDFEAGPVGTWTSQSFGGLNITAENSTYATSAQFSVGGDFAGDYNTRGAYHITNNGTEFQALRFDFSDSVSAFGFLFGASDASWVLSAYDASNTLLDSVTIPAVFGSNAGDFFGLAGLSGASYATLTQNQDGSYASGGVDYVFVDNFSYVGGGSQVPEPATLALLGMAGLAAFGLRRKA